MQVINCSNYVAQREWMALQAAQATAAQPLARPTGVLATLGWWLGGGRSRAIQTRDAAVAQQIDEAARFGKGRWGEEAFIHCLALQLPGAHWVLLHGYKAPQQRSDIDGVLVGPNGATIFEVKALRGFFTVQGDTWWYRRSPRDVPTIATVQPTQQVIGNAERMRRLLLNLGFSWVPVRAVVAFSVDKAEVTYAPNQPSTVPIYLYRTPTAYQPAASIAPYLTVSGRALTQEQVYQLVNALLSATTPRRQ